MEGLHAQGSQSTFGKDSIYYGQGGGGRQPAESQSSFRDDIPLRDHPGVPPKDHMDDDDQVYDRPSHMMEEARPKRRSGMGFLKAPKKKIAWVVYTLTVIQVGVFIGELAKNGRLLSLSSRSYIDF
jgi:hypothetical protein